MCAGKSPNKGPEKPHSPVVSIAFVSSSQSSGARWERSRLYLTNAAEVLAMRQDCDVLPEFAVAARIALITFTSLVPWFPRFFAGVI